MQQLRSTICAAVVTVMYGKFQRAVSVPSACTLTLFHSVWVELQPCRTCTGAGSMLCWLKSCSGSVALEKACSAASCGGKPQADIEAHSVAALLATSPCTFAFEMRAQDVQETCSCTWTRRSVPTGKESPMPSWPYDVLQIVSNVHFWSDAG